MTVLEVAARRGRALVGGHPVGTRGGPDDEGWGLYAPGSDLPGPLVELLDEWARAADSLTRYRGEVVGFCNPGCREKFDAAIGHFEAALAKRDEPLLLKGIE